MLAVMHRRTQELLQHLDQSRQELTNALAPIPAAAWNQQPTAGGWSVANVLSHLARTEGQVAAFLHRALRDALAAGPLPAAPDSADILATLDTTRLLDRTTRFEAPAFAAPDPTMPADAAWHALERARARTHDVLLAGDGIDTRGLQRAHHVLGVLSFEQWLAFVGCHERRHAAQIRDLAPRLAGPHPPVP